MKLKKILPILMLLFIFSLVNSGCTTSKRPLPENQTTPQENRVEENNTVSDSRNGTNNNTTSNDNIMPDRPQPTNPGPSAGFALDDIRKFDLEVELVNKDEINMKYKKGSSSNESKIETTINGKKQTTLKQEAENEIENLIKKIPGASLSDTNTIIDGTLSALKIKREDVKEFDMEFEFRNSEKVSLEFKNE